MIRNKKGFSLVELMVVVAIIGILSAIAIPQINKYMARARQTEAKTNLASIYTANKAFFAEYSIYDNRFAVIGFRPEGKLRYNVGWSAAGNQCALADYGYTLENPSPAIDALGVCTDNVALLGTQADGTTDCFVTPDGRLGALPATELDCRVSFRAGANGKIGSNNDANSTDQWTIDQVKNLVNIRDGSQ